MHAQVLHIYRNTPIGREELFQTAYLCKQMGASLTIYIPKFTKFLMYFENRVVQVNLDPSYLVSPETAFERVQEIVNVSGIVPRFFKPKHFTTATLPDLPTHFDIMCCPISMSAVVSKIGLDYLGPRVRNIIKISHFPVLIPSSVFKPFKSISVFFGGSLNAVKAFKLGLKISKATKLPLYLFTKPENKPQAYYEQIAEQKNLVEDIKNHVKNWCFFEKKRFEENFFEVPHDSLVIMGAYSHSVIQEFMFGSKMKTIQSNMPNNLLIVGPHFET